MDQRQGVLNVIQNPLPVKKEQIGTVEFVSEIPYLLPICFHGNEETTVPTPLHETAAGPGGSTKYFFPVRTFTAALTVTLLLFVALVGYIWNSSVQFETTEKNYFRLSELTGTLAHFDEVLTMSARMAAATGDPQWEARHHEYEPQLEGALNEAATIAKEFNMHAQAASIDSANNKLTMIESEAFVLIRRGNREEALSLLAGPAYEGQKTVFRTVMEQISSTTTTRLNNDIAAQRRHSFYSVLSLLLGVPVLAFAWMTVLRAVRSFSTERRRVEDELQRERNLLRVLIDHQPDMFYFKDADARYVLNNRSHLRSIGAERQEDVLGKTTFDFNPPDLARQYYTDEMQVIRNGEPIYGKEEQAFHKDLGEMRWHLTRKIPLKDSSGTVTGIVCISSDITERKKAEEALELERNLLRTLIDNLPDLIYFKDTKGRYILDNLPHMRSLGAHRPDEVLGKTTFDYNPEEMAKRYFDDEMDIVKTGDAMIEKEEVALHRDTGEQRWHLTSKIPIKDSQGSVTGIVGISHDITHRKQAEEERERLINELKQALADIKTLSGLVPICSNCKKIRDDKGYWTQVEAYVQEHSQAQFSHGFCPECMRKLFPNLKFDDIDRS